MSNPLSQSLGLASLLLQWGMHRRGAREEGADSAMSSSRRLCVMGFWLVCTIITTTGCAPSHAGRTLGRRVLQIEGGLGGPLVQNLGTPIPIPNVPLGVRYGLTDRLDVAGHTNLLTFFTGGFLVLDAELTVGLIRHEGRRGPNLATSVGFAFLSDFQTGARFTPMFDIAGGYTIDWFTIYGGVEVLIDPWSQSVHIDPMVGVEFDIRNFTLFGTFIWYHPFGDGYQNSFEYVSPGDHGGLGLMIGLKGRFDLNEGRRRRDDDD